MSKGLYIHIPFCKYICSYCDFGKKYIKNQPVNDYVKSLVQEIVMYEPFTDVDSIYIGGGTPSSLSQQQLKLIFDKLEDSLDWNAIKEFTFELNPDDCNRQYLEFLKANRVNRLSIGAQVLNDQILKTLNRAHSSRDVEMAVEIATELFENVSVDFMFNLPNQTKADIDHSIEFIENNNLSHVSYYGLIFEDHTILSTKNYKYWSEDYESEIYSYIQENLGKLGYEQYEISNYSKTGKQSIHNIHYWNRDEYYGVGLSGSGYLKDTRYTNTYSLKDYIQKVSESKFPIREQEQLSNEDVTFEQVMLGLRHYKFVEVGFAVVEYIKNDKFLVEKFDIKGNNARLKPEFYYISNQIILDLLERIEC